MARKALSWKRSSVIAWRDLKSAPGKFIFVVLSVAVGVAALVGIRGFSESFRSTLSTEARSLIAGDLSARMMGMPTTAQQKQIGALGAEGIRTTWATETVSMASVASSPVPLLVSLKAIDPTMYPFYGQAELAPQIPLSQALAGDSAVVANEFLIRMHAHVGDMVRIGDTQLRIQAVLAVEPDRISAGAGMGPRVMISRKSLDKSGLIAPGSRAMVRLLLKLPPGADALIARRQVEAILPESQVTDYLEGNPALADGLDNATAVLSLICLVAMVLGAIGVAMAMHAHLDQRMDMLAILKAMGAGSWDLLRIFLLQTLALGIAGSLIGVAAGIAVMTVLPLVFGNLLPIHTKLQLPWSSAAAGLSTGVLTTLLFCMPPLLDVRAVRPLLVLRRMVERSAETSVKAMLTRWWQRRGQVLLSLAVLAVLGLIAASLADSAKIGVAFGVSITVALITLLALSAVLLAILRVALKRVRLHLPSSIRQGLANLYRPGNQSAAVLAALGLGVMLTLSVYLVQSHMLRNLRQTEGPWMPNMYLLDITPDERAGVQVFFRQRSLSLEMLPLLSGRIAAIKGTPIEHLHVDHLPRRYLENAGFSWSDGVPDGDKVISGGWWTTPTSASIAVQTSIAQRLNLKVGDAVTIDISGRTRTLGVAAIYLADEAHVGGRISFILPSGIAGNDPSAIWYASTRVDAAQIPEVERELFNAYPTVTTLNLADVLARIESVVDQITLVIRFLAGFSILAGLMILASSIASTRFRRMRESVVLKTLGATRMHILRVFSVEFSVLGMLAGIAGVIFANLLTSVLLSQLKIDFHAEWQPALVAFVATGALATATGWLASYRILGLKPMEILREE